MTYHGSRDINVTKSGSTDKFGLFFHHYMHAGVKVRVEGDAGFSLCGGQ